MGTVSTDFSCINLQDVVPENIKNAVVAIGNFDGVHRGHQAVLSFTKDLAKSENRPAVVMTFEPHPREFFSPDSPVFRLTTKSQKAGLLDELGLDGVVNVPFDQALANTSAEDFVARILVGKLGAGNVVTGYNFHFGKARQGTPLFLQEAGERFGFGVTTVESFADEGGESISSSRIRAALAAGEISTAAGLLGYRWNIEGVVQQGKKLGRTLGFPTANLLLPDYTRLINGIYAVKVRRADGSLHDGVASFGRRPTFDNGAELFETFLFDFSDDLYDEHIKVSLFGFLRREENFPSADALVEQMKKDEYEARALLAGVQPLSTLDRVLNFAA